MRLTYIPSDGFLCIDGVGVHEVPVPDCGCPDELNAIQLYEDGEIEVEWIDPEKGRCLGNARGCSGLPGGEGFLSVLVSLHAETLAAQEQQRKAEEEETRIHEEEPLEDAGE